MDNEFKKIDVPLDWVQIDNIIVGMRLLNCAKLLDEKFATEIIEHLSVYSMKAKLDK